MVPHHRLLQSVRALHLYLGVFAAPMLLCFAVTGGLQTFGLHETSRVSSYVPPVWLASVAQLHKKQSLVLPPGKWRPPSASASAAAASGSTTPRAAQRLEENKPKRNLLPMKVFFALIALGLFTSVLSGLSMAWRYSRKPGLFGGALVGGMVVPLLLLLL